MKIPIKDYKKTLQNLLDKIQDAAKSKNLILNICDGDITVSEFYPSINRTLEKKYFCVFKNYKHAKKSLRKF